MLSTIVSQRSSGGKSGCASSMTFFTAAIVCIALASLVSWMPMASAGCPFALAMMLFDFAPVSTRATSLSRTKLPSPEARTMMSPNCSGVTRRPSTLPVACFSCISGTGIAPIVPAGACMFCSLIAAATSETVRPSSASLSGLSQTRIE